MLETLLHPLTAAHHRETSSQLCRMIGATACAKVVVAYYASWDIYARNFNVWQIDTTSITHINYAFANISNGQVVQGDPWADSQKVNVGHGDSWSDPADYLHGNFYQLYRLKQANRHLKTMISIGGWTWSGQFSTIASTATSRATFAKSAIDFVNTFGFDGIDIDWEFPGSGGGLAHNARSPDDGANFVLLLDQVRREAAAKGTPILLSAAIGGSIEQMGSLHLRQMDAHLDHFAMMAYDYSGPWSPTTRHHANLQGSEPSVISAARYALSSGVTPRKLVIGMPLYGRSFATTTGLGQPFAGAGGGTWEPGLYDYRRVAEAAGGRACLRGGAWDVHSKATYCHDLPGGELISYDDSKSLAAKLDAIASLDLGGLMFWEISADYPTSDGRSLLAEAARRLDGCLDRSTNRLSYPRSPYRNLADGGRQQKAAGEARQALFTADTNSPEWNAPLRAKENWATLEMPRAHYNYMGFMETRKKMLMAEEAAATA